MEINFKFIKEKPKKILIYDFSKKERIKFVSNDSINFKFYNGNFRIYSWPYCKLEISIKNNNVITEMKGKYSYYFNFNDGKFTNISDRIKFSQRFKDSDHSEKIRIRNNFYWYNLHYFFKNYYPKNPSDNDKNQVRNLFNHMRGRGILCSKCRRHFNEYLNKHPYDKLLDCPQKLFIYTVNLHNDVNHRNYKPTFTYDQAEKMYKKSISFNVYLKLVCKPAYIFFEEGRLHLFPDTINNQTIIRSL